MKYKVKIKPAGRPKNTDIKRTICPIRPSTLTLLRAYKAEQRESTGINLTQIDLLDIAVRSLVTNKDFFQFAVDFRNKKV